MLTPYRKAASVAAYPTIGGLPVSSARAALIASNKSGAKSHEAGTKASKNTATNDALIATSVGMFRSLIQPTYH